MSSSGGGVGNSHSNTTNNYSTTNTTNKSTPIAAKTTSGPAAAGYKSTFNITTKTGGSKVAEAALSANSNATDAALSFASSVGKADINLLQSATGQIVSLAGKKIQTATQAATGTAPTQSSKTVEYGVVGLVGLGAAYLLMRKR